MAFWNEFAEHCYLLGYGHLCGPHLRKLQLDRTERTLGCLQSDFAVPQLACRDHWLGRQDRKHHSRVVPPSLL